MLEVLPVTPTPDGPRDAYMVTLRHQGSTVYYRQHSVYKWQLRHYDVHKIAFAFQSARRLLDQTFDFSLYDSAAAPEHRRDRKERSCLSVSTDWLEFVLSGQTNKYRGPIRVVRLFLEEETADSGGFVRGVRADFICSVQEAEQFGKTLLQECNAAEQSRIAQGIPGCDSDGFDTSNDGTV